MVTTVEPITRGRVACFQHDPDASFLQHLSASLQDDRMIVDDENLGHARIRPRARKGCSRRFMSQTIVQTIQWNHNAHTSATPGFAVYLVAAAQCLHALPHAADAETDRRRGINPAPAAPP